MFETLSLLLFLYKLSRENTKLENMCDNDFEKNKMWTLNRTRVYVEAVVQSFL